METGQAMDFVFESSQSELVNINMLQCSNELILSCTDPHFVKAFDGMHKNLLKEELLKEIIEQEHQNNLVVLKLGEKQREVIKTYHI